MALSGVRGRAVGVALAAVALVAGAWFVAAQRAPRAGEATTLWLAATSLAGDRDLDYGAPDAARYRAAFGAEPAGVWKDAAGRLQAPALPALVAAAGAIFSAARGPLVAQALLVLLAALGLERALRPRLGAAAATAVLLALSGSAAFRFGLDLAPETTAFAAVAIGYALVWGRRAGLAAVPTEVFSGELPGAPRLARWLGAGLGLGVAASLSPAYLVLAAPPWGALPRARRGAAAALYALGLTLPLALAVAVEGSPWEPLQLVPDLRLVGWNALDFLVGRHVGALPYFLPLLLGFLAPARDAGRAWIPVAAAIAALFLLIGSPFDWAGAAPAWGNAALLPIFAALVSRAGAAVGRARALLLLALAAPFLLPLWLAPVSGSPWAGSAGLRRGVEAARSLLPFETALRSLPASAEILRAGVALRATGETLYLAASGERMYLFGRRGEALVESPRPLSSVRLEFGAAAPSSLTVRGGEVGNTIFRPSGEIAFDVALGAPLRRHPLWWSREPVSIYRLRLDLGRDPSAPLPFALALARPAVPAEGAE